MFHNINLRICEILLSLPSRERGLKYKVFSKSSRHGFVAPFAGAWIEIIKGLYSGHSEHVAPFAGAWIEIKSVFTISSADPVAPFAGAWIEIIMLWNISAKALVAPFAGAWIEISKMLEISWSRACRSLRGSVD